MVGLNDSLPTRNVHYQERSLEALAMQKKKTKQTLADAVRRGQQRNKERGLPYGRGTEHLLDEPRLSRFDLQFLKLSEKGWSERLIAALLLPAG